jgi:hypothetical protein
MLYLYTNFLQELNNKSYFMNVQPPTAFVEGKVGLKRILPTRAEGDADYEPTVSNSLFDFNLHEYDFTVRYLRYPVPVPSTMISIDLNI